MKPEVSIVIPYLNDPEVVIGTIENVYETIDVSSFEVILIDDGSKDSVPKDFKKDGLFKYRHFINLGVGKAFNTGVGISHSDNIILLGADVRFEKNGWCRRMLNVLNKNERSLICANCESAVSPSSYYGADIVFYMTNENLSDLHPKRNDPSYRSIFEGKWRPKTGRGVYEVPCLMGAFYGVKKEWFDNINGFELHYKWGSLEPMISIRSWQMGGNVLVDSDNKAKHLFGRNPNRMNDFAAILYNQLIIANVSFGTYGVKYAQHLESKSSAWERACEMHMDRIDAVRHFRRYFDEHSVLSNEEVEKKLVDLSVCYNQDDSVYINPIGYDWS